MKYKIGDKVKIVEWTDAPTGNSTPQVDNVGVIYKIREGTECPYDVENLDGERVCSFYEQELELIIKIGQQLFLWDDDDKL